MVLREPERPQGRASGGIRADDLPDVRLTTPGGGEAVKLLEPSGHDSVLPGLIFGAVDIQQGAE